MKLLVVEFCHCSEVKPPILTKVLWIFLITEGRPSFLQFLKEHVSVNSVC